MVKYFTENIGVVNEEQGENCNQDIEDIEQRCQRKWDVNNMADCCSQLHHFTGVQIK